MYDMLCAKMTVWPGKLILSKTPKTPKIPKTPKTPKTPKIMDNF